MLVVAASFHSLLQWIDSEAVAGRENNVDNHRSGIEQESVDILYVDIWQKRLIKMFIFLVETCWSIVVSSFSRHLKNCGECRGAAWGKLSSRVLWGFQSFALHFTVRIWSSGLLLCICCVYRSRQNVSTDELQDWTCLNKQLTYSVLK